ncbi:hypothetical protein Clacol_004189 [Clathrus columnatus]|uniref:Uncharacterized protein n=1 Tax=Clathrus columnatus TaxID=1419009 RepID=A0AAV5A9R9_9AGAM|nr:hypothetical protein Clacol_004189 [Clathrus columnatus]
MQGETCAFKCDSFKKCDGLPPRPPSNLPPPGNEHLSITLGNIVGNGRIGTVTSLTHNIELPPLVAKISRCKRSASLEQEAWFYEELEQVQGIAVPRCYGLFQTHIQEGTEVRTWKEDMDDDESDSEFDGPIVCEGFSPPKPGEPIVTPGAVLTRPVLPVPDPTLLSILVLERMGDKMPIEQPLDDIKPDVYEIYDDLGLLSIEHMDIRWRNILKVLPGQELFSSVCPNHGHVHQWRAVDFDLARKTNSSRAYMEKFSNGWLRRLFDKLPEGIIAEPWQ